MPEIELGYADPGTLRPHPSNPRKITPQALAKLKESLREFGMPQPAVVNKTTGYIVGGHQRVRAAREMGWEKVPVIYIELETEAQEAALMIALNNDENTGEWDLEKLVDRLNDVKKDSTLLAATGYDDYQVERFQRQLESQTAAPPVYPISSKFLEHYDYVVIFSTNEMDWVRLKDILQIRTEASYKKGKKGIGRVVPVTEFFELWEGRDRPPPAETKELTKKGKGQRGFTTDTHEVAEDEDRDREGRDG